MDVSTQIDCAADSVEINAQYGFPVGVLIFLAFLVPLQTLALLSVHGPERGPEFWIVAGADFILVAGAFLIRPKAVRCRVTTSSFEVLRVRRWGYRSKRILATAEVLFVGFTPGSKNTPGGMFAAIHGHRDDMFLIGVSESQTTEFLDAIRNTFPEIADRWERWGLYNRSQVLSLHIE